MTVPRADAGGSPVVAPRAADEFKVNNFDGLRILAALQVVLAHSRVHLDIPRLPFWSLLESFPGVPIFFAISGFLISASFERTPRLESYARNRLLRILPALWCVILVTIPVAAAFGFEFRRPEAAVWLLCQLVGLIYTPQFLHGFGFGSYNGALWTIPIELQFYVLLPLLYLGGARLARGRTTLVAVVLLAFTIVAYQYATTSPPLAENAIEPLARKLFRYSFIPHVYLFLAGVVLQRVHAQRSRWIAGKGVFWLAGYLAVHYGLPAGAFNYVLGTLVMAVMTVSLAYTAPRASGVLLRGNDISYGVYIYHGLILNVLIELGIGRSVVHLPLVALLTIGVAFLSWRLVERPFLRRKRQTLHAVAPGPA